MRARTSDLLAARRWRLVFVAFSMTVTLVTVVGGSTSAEAVEEEFEDTLVAAISAPLDIAWTPDGRILIPTKGGKLWVIENDVVQTSPAIDLGSIMCTNGERALGGVAVHPNFSVNRYIYLYYAFKKFGTCNESEIDGPVTDDSPLHLHHSATPTYASQPEKPPTHLNSLSSSRVHDRRCWSPAIGGRNPTLW